MKRRIIKQSNQAMTITLPIEWVRQNNLKSGDEIDLEIIEKTILIKTNRKSQGEKIKIDVSDLNKRGTRWSIDAAYAYGIDEIEAEINPNNHNELAQNIGYAVVEQKGDSYKIKDVAGPTANDLDEIFKRLFQMILAFYDNMIDDVFSDSKTPYDVIKQTDREINKYALFLERAIMKNNYENKEAGKIIFSYAFKLENIGDHIFSAWELERKNKVDKNSKVKEIFLIAKKCLEKTFETNYHLNNKQLIQLMMLRGEIFEKLMKLTNVNNNTSQFVSYAMRVVEDCEDLVQLIIMTKIGKEVRK